MILGFDSGQIWFFFFLGGGGGGGGWVLRIEGNLIFVFFEKNV